MEPLSVDEDIEAKFNISKYSLGLRGMDRILRCAHLLQVQNKSMELSEPIQRISYGPEEEQGLNVMRCDTNRDNETILVFIHGGAWVEGDRHVHNFVANGLQQHNLSVITLGYRKATKGSGIDHCVEDVVAGIQKVQEMFPTSNLLLAGHSAGGHLLMAALPRLPNLRGILKVFCVSGIYSLWELMHTSAGVLIGFNRDQCEKYSITAHHAYDNVDLHLVVAQHDPPAFRTQAERFAALLKRRGFRQRTVEIIPNEDHFSIMENLFYKKAALTRLFAGVYDPMRRRSKL